MDTCWLASGGSIVIDFNSLSTREKANRISLVTSPPAPLRSGEGRSFGSEEELIGKIRNLNCD